VAEGKWVPGWDPEFVISSSGVAELDCIFQTFAEGQRSVWIMNRYEPERLYLEIYKIMPGHTVGKLRIQLSLIGEDETLADISYEYTSLGNAGDVFLKGFTAEYYSEFMQRWEKALNHYLKTGKRIA
jgi:hypothetical protein